MPRAKARTPAKTPACDGGKAWQLRTPGSVGDYAGEMSSDGVAPPVTPGTVLAGKYRVESVIGQGGMGVVVEARHIQLEERVALKFLLPEYARHPDASARFLREARAAVRIKSQHVARVSDVGTLETGSPYMVMEYLEGGDIEQQLLAAGTLPVEDAVDAIIQAAEAIAEAHSLGIVHRDIKPANLFVARHSDGSPLVKVLDFGISKMIDASSQGLTRTATTMGSALYMSPEQLRDARSVDHRADIYALGVSLYEMLSGRQPFTADTFPQLCVLVATGDPTPLAEVRPDLPYDFAQVVEKAFKRDPNDRYQSVAELVLALAPWAPARSQQLVERIARTAGYAPRASMPSLSQTGPGQPAPAAPGSTTDLLGGGDPPAVKQPGAGGRGRGVPWAPRRRGGRPIRLASAQQGQRGSRCQFEHPRGDARGLVGRACRRHGERAGRVRQRRSIGERACAVEQRTGKNRQEARNFRAASRRQQGHLADSQSCLARFSEAEAEADRYSHQECR